MDTYKKNEDLKYEIKKRQVALENEEKLMYLMQKQGPRRFASVSPITKGNHLQKADSHKTLKRQE